MNVSSPQAASSSNETELEADKAKRAKLARRSIVYGGILYAWARVVYSTLRIKIVNESNLNFSGSGSIFVTWHGRSFVPANLFRGRGFWALISLSRDGELQNNIFKRFGFQTVRGSTGRGGVKGALQMARKVKEGGVLAFTPDGPRGPTHKVQLGVILMAEKSGVPIIPMGISADRRRLFSSWDSYFVPKLFARTFIVVGEAIVIPVDLNDEKRKEYAEKLEFAINRVECEAERLAGHTEYPNIWPIK